MITFDEAKNEQGYLKMNLYGFPGSGKTFTASLIAIGLAKKTKKPVFALDTENGFSYIERKYKEAGVGLEVARSRAFADSLDAIAQAEQKASVLIIDSVSHLWAEIRESYQRKNNRDYLTLKDWGPIKETWNYLPTAFLNSKVHIILCGRAADDVVAQEDENTHKLEVVKYGTKLAAEKNLGYEPGLVVEMEKIAASGFKPGVRNMVNRAHVLKDRFDVLDGKSFDDPTYETFLPHISLLNAQTHSQIPRNSSDKLFDGDSQGNWERRQRVEILLQEIDGELSSVWPGRSPYEIKMKTDAVAATFNTRSWTQIQAMPPEHIKTCFGKLKEWIQKNGPETGKAPEKPLSCEIGPAVKSRETGGKK